MENDEEEKNNVGPEYPGEGATKTTVARFIIDDATKTSGPRVPGRGVAKTTVDVSIFDDFCIIQAKITDPGLLLVPIHGDTLTNLKTENGGVVKGHNNKKKKIENDEEEKNKVGPE